MARQKGTLSLASNIEPSMAAPLDARDVVNTVADLTTEGSFPYSYVGMKVTVKATGDLYILTGADPTLSASWKKVGSDIVVPTKTSDLTNDSGFIDNTVNNLTNYYLKTETYTQTEIDTMVSTAISGRFILVNSLPTENISTSAIYLVPKSDGGTSGNVKDEYINTTGTSAGWEHIGDTQVDMDFGIADLNDVELTSLSDGQVLRYDATSEKFINVTLDTGSGELTSPITSSIEVGGIEASTTYPTGTPIEEIIGDLLAPTLYPTLTAPTATLTATGSKLIETGDTLDTTFTIVFNRGSISPAYGTSGYRAGEATEYSLADGAGQAGNTFVVTITSAKTSYKGAVSYEAGEQPKDSKGANYNSPLAAGSIETNVVSWEFVDALYANTSDIATVSKLALVSKTAGNKEFTFPAQTVANPEVFDVPASWTVTSVKVLNTLSNQWEDCASEFTVTDTIHTDAAGENVAYKRYTDNRGYNAGSRKIKITWT